jgi:hypothetical protein
MIPAQRPPLDAYAVLVGVLDSIVTLAQILVEAGVITHEDLAKAYRTAAAQQAKQEPLVDPRVRGTPVAVLANTFAARIKPAPERPRLVVDNDSAASHAEP